MPLLLYPQDFTEPNFEKTLIRLLKAEADGDDIISERAVPPEFHIFSSSKGCELEVSTEFIGGDSNYAGWKIVPVTVGNWDIHVGDVVKLKSYPIGNNMNVLHETELLAKVDYFDLKLTNKQTWVLKADLVVIHRASGGFRNEGEL